MTVIVWLLLCVPSDGMGGHFCVLVCGCDHAPFLCGCVALCVSLSCSMHMSLCGHVAVVVGDTASLQ